MAQRSDRELSRLRRTVAAYLRALIAVGLSAQTLASAGGNYLAVSRLISSGIALAGQLQRGVIVRVVGAPLVRRRPQRRPRGGGQDEYPEPGATLGQEASDGYQPETEWEEPVPPPLAVAEIDSQPFSLARMLPSLVAAQQSTFRALSSVNGAVARAVGATGFAPNESRAFPSQTSFEQRRGASPETFPENQATSFAGEAPALAVGAAFRGAASAMAFNLSRAAHEMTNMALGSQAVGATFASARSRVANEGTAFLPSSEAAPAPSLLQQSITGSVDTSFRSPMSGGANLGIAARSGGAPSSPGTAPAVAPSDLPLARESPGASDLSAQVGGPSGGPSGSVPPGASAPVANVELNAGPYATPNGFNSVFASPAFVAATELSMQVRSLAASGASAQLPLRASQAPSASEAGALGMAVVPEQYPASYPAGAAYSVSNIVASLGLGGSAPAGARQAEQERKGPGLATEEAPGMEVATETVGGAFVGGSLEGRGSVTAGASASPAGAARDVSAMDAEIGGTDISERVGSGTGVKLAPGSQLAPYRQVFGERWLTSISNAVGIGSTMMGMLTVSAASPLPASLASAVAETQVPGAAALTGALDKAPASQGRRIDSAQALRDTRGVLAMPLGPAEAARRPSLAASPSGVREGPGSQASSQLVPELSARQDFPLSAKPRDQAASSASSGQVSRSVWEAATLLPGILTPASVVPPTAEAVREQPSSAKSLPQELAAVATAQPPQGGLWSSRSGLDALRLAASTRSAIVASAATLLGAKASGYVSPRAPLAPLPEPSYEGEASGARGPEGFVAHGTSNLANRRIGFLGLSAETKTGERPEEAPPVQKFTTSYLPAVQAALTSRASLAARVSGSLANAIPLSGAAAPSAPPRPEIVAGGLSGRQAGAPAAALGPSEPARSLKQTAGPAETRPEAILTAQALRDSGAIGKRDLPLSAPSPVPGALPPSLGQSFRAAMPTQAAPEGAARELEAALASQSREGRGFVGGSVFGLEAVAQAMSLAARLPTAAHLNAAIAATLPRARAQPRSEAAAKQMARSASSEVQYAERPSQLVEGWRSAPEEALTKMLAEPSRQQPAPSAEASQEPDDNELRRRIEKIIEEELRRHGYQP